MAKYNLSISTVDLQLGVLPYQLVEVEAVDQFGQTGASARWPMSDVEGGADDRIGEDGCGGRAGAVVGGNADGLLLFGSDGLCGCEYGSGVGLASDYFADGGCGVA